MNDLTDTTIYALGEYSSYEKELRYILTANGVDDKEVEFKYIDSYKDAFEIDNAIVVMPEPYASDFVENNGGNVCLDFESEWNTIVEREEIPAPFITSVIVSNTDFIESKSDIVREFLTYANMSANDLNSEMNEGNNILEVYGVSDKAIENTNITYIAEEDMAFFIGAYAFALEEYVKLPDDDFYFWG